jgi:hypothetical protein
MLSSRVQTARIVFSGFSIPDHTTNHTAGYVLRFAVNSVLVVVHGSHHFPGRSTMMSAEFACIGG